MNLVSGSYPAACLVVALLAQAAASAVAANTIDFDATIRPLLVAKCCRLPRPRRAGGRAAARRAAPGAGLRGALRRPYRPASSPAGVAR